MTLIKTLTTLADFQKVQYQDNFGVPQLSRFEDLSGDAVPASASTGLAKPANARHVQLRSFYNTTDPDLSKRDYLVTSATAGTTTTSVLTLTQPDGSPHGIQVESYFLNQDTNEMFRAWAVNSDGTINVTDASHTRGIQNYAAATAWPAGSQFKVIGGDINDSGNNDPASRAEMYTGLAVPSSTPAANWEYPYLSIRWFRFSVLLGSGWVFDTTGAGNKYVTLTQFKGIKGGSPEAALELKYGTWRWGGANNTQYPNNGNLTSAKPGEWTQFIIGMRFSHLKTEGLA